MIQNWKFQRGDIFFTRFDNAIGSEQGGNRPAVVLQNDVGNFYSPTLIVATLTSKAAKKYTQPTHCLLVNDFLSVPSIVQAEQIFTIDKSRVLKYLGHLTPEEMSRVDDAVRASLALNPMGSIHGQSLLSGNAYCGHCGAKLTLTSSRKWRKLSDGTLDDTLRVRYTCYGKLRKQTGCTGQTGYTVHILDEIIDKSVRQIFSKMRGIPKEQIITRRYEREVVERKNHLQTIQVERDKAQKDLISLKAEILACIKGESVFPKETLAEMITAQEEKLRELDALYESSYAETEKTAELMDNVSKLYEELISFSDLYDSASFEAKKMIVNQLIRRVDVYRGYQLNITFNFDLTPYIEGDDAAAC